MISARIKYYTVRLIYIMIDSILISASIYLACMIRAQTLPFEVSYFTLFVDPINPYRDLFVFWMVSTILSLNSRALYQTKREFLEGYEIGLIIKSVLLAVVVVVVAIYALKVEGFPRGVLSIGTTIMLITLSLWRILKRMYVEYLVSRGYNNFNAIVIGAGRVGVALAHEIRKKPGLGIKIVGFLDDFKTEEEVPKTVKILGKLSEFKKIARREFVTKVFITIHHDSDVFLKILEEARDLGIAVQVIPQGFELMPGEFTKYNIGIIPILEYSDIIPLRTQVGKRMFDFIASSIGLIFLAPVYLFICILIKMDSKGPVIYISKRYGRNGQIFNMFKFRSMHIDADQNLNDLKDKNEADGPIFKMKNDPRVTQIGRILRKYSLDELPQILNVFLGHMSLVGPRPFPIAQIQKEDLKQLRRLEVRPGITGLWQIRGRSDISFKRLVKWDIWYINNWSFWLDLNILFQTVPIVFHGRGAY